MFVLNCDFVFLYPFFPQIIEQFQKCHVDHPVAKFFNECTDLKIKLDRCFREEVSSNFLVLVCIFLMFERFT